jgi:hypothetical protein
MNSKWCTVGSGSDGQRNDEQIHSDENDKGFHNTVVLKVLGSDDYNAIIMPFCIFVHILILT